MNFMRLFNAIKQKASLKTTRLPTTNTNSNRNSYRTKLALIVRNDLKMSKGKLAAQCAHAAVLCYQAAQENDIKQTTLESWCFNGQPKIVLRVEKYEDIAQLAVEAKKVGITTAIVKDAGHTQLPIGTTTVLGIGPDEIEKIDKLVAHLKLL